MNWSIRYPLILTMGLLTLLPSALPNDFLFRTMILRYSIRTGAPKRPLECPLMTQEDFTHAPRSNGAEGLKVTGC